jgi:hypothetical protein
MANKEATQRRRRRRSTTLGVFRTTTGTVVVAVAAIAVVILLPHVSTAFELSPNGGGGAGRTNRNLGSTARGAPPLNVSSSTILPSWLNIGLNIGGGKAMENHLQDQQQQQQQQHATTNTVFFRPTPPTRPPPLKRRTLYDILGATSTTESRAELKQRYARLVRLCHPDALRSRRDHSDDDVDDGNNIFLNSRKHAEPLPPPPGHSSPWLDFNEINMAWSMLSDAEYRRVYDAALAAQQQQQSQPPLPPVPPHVIAKSAAIREGAAAAASGRAGPRPMKHPIWDDPKWQEFSEVVMNAARDQMATAVKAIVDRAVPPLGGLCLIYSLCHSISGVMDASSSSSFSHFA